MSMVLKSVKLLKKRLGWAVKWWLQFYLYAAQYAFLETLRSVYKEVVKCTIPYFCICYGIQRLSSPLALSLSCAMIQTMEISPRKSLHTRCEEARQEVVKEMHQLRADGFTMEAIGKAYGVRRSTVNYLLKAYPLGGIEMVEEG